MLMEIIAFCGAVFGLNMVFLLGLIAWYKESDKGPIAYKPNDWTWISTDYHQKSIIEKLRFTT